MKDLLKAIGQEGTISLGGLIVCIKVLDVKVSYGRTRYLVTPVTGLNEVWVEKISLPALED